MDNIEEKLVEQGRLMPRPCSRWPTTTVAKLDMDVLFTVLSKNLTLVLRFNDQLRWQLYDEDVDIDAFIDEAITHYCHQALNELWNRLRAVAGSYDFNARDNIFHAKAPSMFDFVFPQFFATLLSGIGPLYISGTLSDTVVIYAPEENRQYFGRSESPNINVTKIRQFQDALRNIKVPLAKIQTKNQTYGSYFTTCGRVTKGIGFFNILGSLQPSLYSHDDVIMAMLFGDFGAADNPFEDLSVSVGFVDDKATVQALASIDLIVGLTLTRPTRHVGGKYEINDYGLAPASSNPFNGKGQGFYVVGRGFTHHNLTYLAQNITECDIYQILRYRILHAPTTT
ncbi:hypothetical protein FRX31_011897 [Thalictrum thalictroides]|uniref:Uncharacterized protein n=1 Tax=Thalictrum thalictroides TaxID=46969 RepID=A0A7J6WMB8_THATH|nr:hypothetical protein FRX31_011897 [Thalictrum thalictroides]